MKELRFDAAGAVWRVAFAFHPKRNAVLLIAGNKSGGGERDFIVGSSQRPTKDSMSTCHERRRRGDSHANHAEGQNEATEPRPTQEGRGLRL
jgi:Phage derived protein Gp49-like (DUF891)